jgi:hypothetical protein
VSPTSTGLNPQNKTVVVPVLDYSETWLHLHQKSGKHILFCLDTKFLWDPLCILHYFHINYYWNITEQRKIFKMVWLVSSIKLRNSLFKVRMQKHTRAGRVPILGHEHNSFIVCSTDSSVQAVWGCSTGAHVRPHSYHSKQ